MGMLALVVVIVVLAGGNDDHAGNRRKEPVRKRAVVERNSTATPVASEPKLISVAFKLPRDSFGVFTTRSSRALVVGRIRPAQAHKVYWELRKVPGARLVDKGVVSTGADGTFHFVALGLRRGEYRLLVDTSRIDFKTSSATSIAIRRRAPKPAPTPTPTPRPTPTATTTPKPAANCDPSYRGACLKPDSPDYDCEGGSGDGPDYTGEVRVVGPDHYDLDRDGDGIACDT
jgi:hypothetical protein